MPGLGANITWNPTSSFKLLTNDYYGTDDGGVPQRKRFHTDNSMLVRYFNQPQSTGISKMALSLTGDLGFEKGGGVNGFSNGDSAKGPAQYFLSSMIYSRIWFAKNKFAWTIGGGVMTNPLAPTPAIHSRPGIVLPISIGCLIKASSSG
jgi:Putative beta-barrel porin-2, OmpL-like. bbp2